MSVDVHQNLLHLAFSLKYGNQLTEATKSSGVLRIVSYPMRENATKTTIYMVPRSFANMHTLLH